MSGGTVRVRIAVRVGANGKWGACGDSGYSLEAAFAGMSLPNEDVVHSNGYRERNTVPWSDVIIEADVPLPLPTTIEAKAVPQ